MEKHVTLVGILNIVYRSLAIIGALVLFALAFGFRYFMEFISRFDHNEMHEIPPGVLNIVPIILAFVGVLIMILLSQGSLERLVC